MFLSVVLPMPIRFQIAGFRSRRSANPTDDRPLAANPTKRRSSVLGALGVSAVGNVGDDGVPMTAVTAFPPPALLIEEAIGADLLYV
jgi:hypothetical protein